jgi:DNA invertase Pin-like site-specific DNA recombinase
LKYWVEPILSVYASSDRIKGELLLLDRRDAFMTTAKRAVIYSRSSKDTQATENQLLQLRSYSCLLGYDILAELSDPVGAAKGKDYGFKRLRTMVARREVDIVLCWSVDILSRSLNDLVAFLQELRVKQVDLFLHHQDFDTSTPSGRDTYRLLEVFSELEQSLTRSKILAGLERARAQGRLGRPSVASNPTVIAEVRALKAAGVSANAIAKKLKIGVGTTHRILAACGASPLGAPAGCPSPLKNAP